MFELQAEYEDVGLEAIRQARRNGSDFVSAVDIESADRTIRARGRRTAWAEALGGILAGAGTGTFLQVAVETNPSILGLSIAAILAAIGLIVTTAALRAPLMSASFWLTAASRRGQYRFARMSLLSPWTTSERAAISRLGSRSAGQSRRQSRRAASTMIVSRMQLR